MPQAAANSPKCVISVLRPSQSSMSIFRRAKLERSTPLNMGFARMWRTPFEHNASGRSRSSRSMCTGENMFMSNFHESPPCKAWILQPRGPGSRGKGGRREGGKEGRGEEGGGKSSRDCKWKKAGVQHEAAWKRRAGDQIALSFISKIECMFPFIRFLPYFI